MNKRRRRPSRTFTRLEDIMTSNQTPEQEKKRLNRKKATVIAAALAVSIGVGSFCYTNYIAPRNRAIEKYNTEASKLEERNQDLVDEIKELQDILKSKEKPLDPAVAKSAGDIIGKAQAAREDAPERADSTEEINAQAGSIAKMGTYKDEIAELDAAQQSMRNSIAQRKQVTNPSEKFVLDRLAGLPNITAAEAVTEGNDPNNQLGKKGGYTAAVVFRSDLVPDSELYLSGEYTPIVDAGCDGGGTVEVYKTSSDAKKRNEYLGGFDGSIFSSGSHTVCGSCVVRTSEHLTASQQQAIQQEIIDSLTRL